MPTQIKGDIKIAPERVLQKPDLAAQLTVLFSYWTEIEDSLAVLFAFAMRTRPVMAAVVFGRVNSLPARLDMLEEALAFAVSELAAGHFRKAFRERIRKCSGLRATLAHSMWTTRDDCPDRLIRFGGLTEPDGGFWAYDKRDFAELALRFLELSIALREFSQSLAGGQDFAGPTKDGWQFRAPDSDQPV